MLDLNASKIDNIHTYVEYLIKRPNPNEYDAFQSGTVLEDFENGNFVENLQEIPFWLA